MDKLNLENECAKELLGQEPAPFDVYLFKDLLDSERFSQIRKEAGSVKCDTINNDLYQFKQSKGLLDQMGPKEVPKSIRKFGQIMLDWVKPHLEKLANLKLSQTTFDMTVSYYGRGDYLLCHNDDCKDSRKRARALAFVYYLNEEPFTDGDGGALLLYKSDDKSEPVEVSHRINPIPNSLIVFRTGSTSWHCVEEVYGRDDRLSINGWFHLENPATSSIGQLAQVEACPYTFMKPTALDDRHERFFKECINGEYQMEKTCYLVRRKFKKASEINLTDFLVKEKYQEICSELKKAVSEEENLEMVGPCIKRHYKRLRVNRLPQICQDLFDAFRSEFFFVLLSRLTGLDLQPPSLFSSDDKVPGDSSDEDPEDMEDDGETSGGEDGDSGDNHSGADSEEEEEVGEEREVEDSEVDEGGRESRVGEASAQNQKRKHKGDGSSSADDIEGEAKPSKRKRVSDPLVRLELRHLDAGSYTLIHDYAYETAEKSALDVVLHFNHDFEVNFDAGGYISYMDASDDHDVKPEDCELLTVEPKSNCLSLIYREKGTCRFLKYINKSHKSAYQDLSCVYYEKPDDLPGLVAIDGSS